MIIAGLHLRAALVDIQICVEIATYCSWTESFACWRCVVSVSTSTATHFVVHLMPTFITFFTDTLLHLIVNELLDIFVRVQNVDHGRVEACALRVREEDIGA